MKAAVLQHIPVETPRECAPVLRDAVDALLTEALPHLPALRQYAQSFLRRVLTA